MKRISLLFVLTFVFVAAAFADTSNTLPTSGQLYKLTVNPKDSAIQLNASGNGGVLLTLKSGATFAKPWTVKIAKAGKKDVASAVTSGTVSLDSKGTAVFYAASTLNSTGTLSVALNAAGVNISTFSSDAPISSLATQETSGTYSGFIKNISSKAGISKIAVGAFALANISPAEMGTSMTIVANGTPDAKVKAAQINLSNVSLASLDNNISAKVNVSAKGKTAVAVSAKNVYAKGDLAANVNGGDLTGYVIAKGTLTASAKKGKLGASAGTYAPTSTSWMTSATLSVAAGEGLTTATFDAKKSKGAISSLSGDNGVNVIVYAGYSKPTTGTLETIVPTSGSYVKQIVTKGSKKAPGHIAARLYEVELDSKGKARTKFVGAGTEAVKYGNN